MGAGVLARAEEDLGAQGGSLAGEGEGEGEVRGQEEGRGWQELAQHRGILLLGLQDQPGDNSLEGRTMPVIMGGQLRSIGEGRQQQEEEKGRKLIDDGLRDRRLPWPATGYRGSESLEPH